MSIWHWLIVLIIVMLLFGTVSVSLIWMHFRRYSDVQHPREEAEGVLGKAAAQ